MTATTHQANRLTGSKTASRIFFADPPKARPVLPSQVTETHLESVTYIFDFAPGCAVAPNSTAGLIASAGGGMFSDGSIPYVSRGGEAAAAGQGGVIFNDPRLVPGGVLTLAAANEHYRNGNGTPLMVIAGNLDFSGVNPNGFNPATGNQPYRFPATGPDFPVYGTVTLHQNPGTDTFRVLPDNYGFEMHSWTAQPVRNVLTLAGAAVATRGGTSSGTPYDIIFFGVVDLPPPPPPKKDGPP
jgi:hypothetical protein